MQTRTTDLKHSSRGKLPRVLSLHTTSFYRTPQNTFVTGSSSQPPLTTQHVQTADSLELATNLSLIRHPCSPRHIIRPCRHERPRLHNIPLSYVSWQGGRAKTYCP